MWFSCQSTGTCTILNIIVPYPIWEWLIFIMPSSIVIFLMKSSYYTFAFLGFASTGFYFYKGIIEGILWPKFTYSFGKSPSSTLSIADKNKLSRFVGFFWFWLLGADFVTTGEGDTCYFYRYFYLYLSRSRSLYLSLSFFFSSFLPSTTNITLRREPSGILHGI